MHVKAETVLTLIDLMNDSVVPEAAFEACEQLTDAQVADLLELFVVATEDAGEKPSVFIRSAIRRLRRDPKETEPNS